MWTLLDVFVFGKPLVIGAVQCIMTGLVCITPGASLVQGWAAIVMGIVGGSIPWFTMMIVHKSWEPMQGIDDTFRVFHTHAVWGLLGGLLTGLFAHPYLTRVFLGDERHSHDRGAVYGGEGGKQIWKQLVGGLICNRLEPSVYIYNMSLNKTRNPDPTKNVRRGVYQRRCCCSW
ncbi:Ammonium transporter 3 member 3 [Bienertia sinuspersici]